MKFVVPPFLFLLLFMSISYAQSELTYAEKLGFPKGKKVVIFHVDDVGMSYESNQGTIQALEKGLASSLSIMMPCGWVPGFFDYLKQHPTVDAGIHLVMTSEWTAYRWAPLTGRDKALGLYDGQGAFWRSVPEVVTHASPDEVETEMRAQIARYRAFGLQPTHLDSHMGTLFEPAFLERYVKVGISEKIPILFPGGHASLITAEARLTTDRQQLLRQIGQQLWDAGLPVLDDLDGSSYGWNLPAGQAVTDDNLRKYKTGKYIELLKAAKPGLTYVIMHCTDPTEVFSQISNSGPSRKGDLLAMTDPALKAFVEREGIIVTTWRELSERRAKIK
ncbi:MAG: polysaccharide deacetylase family protein [Bacteroidetes bacterium]|nr:polysaccharide deacetylase family protein [Fibrella sp.]